MGKHVDEDRPLHVMQPKVEWWERRFVYEWDWGYQPTPHWLRLRKPRSYGFVRVYTDEIGD